MNTLETLKYPHVGYNLDRKNPNNQTDFEHLPPEQLVNDILEKDRRVAEIMSEIKAILEQ